MGESTCLSSAVDWKEVQREWEGGVPTKDLAYKYKCTSMAIAMTARKRGWGRDPVKLKEAKEIKKLAFKKAVGDHLGMLPAEMEDMIDSARDLDDADLQASVVYLHRKHISQYRDLADTLFDELRSTCEDKDLFRKVAEIATSEKVDEEAVKNLNKVMEKMASLPSRVKALKELAETSKIIVAIERESFGMRPIDYDDSARKAMKNAAEVVVDGFEHITAKFNTVLGEARDVTPKKYPDEVTIN